MITRVLDEKGRVTHDCLALGCEISWDGYALKDGVNVAPPARPGETPAPPHLLAKGERTPGAADPGPEWRQVDERTVRRIPDAA